MREDRTLVKTWAMRALLPAAEQAARHERKLALAYA